MLSYDKLDCIVVIAAPPFNVSNNMYVLYSIVRTVNLRKFA